MTRHDTTSAYAALAMPLRHEEVLHNALMLIHVSAWEFKPLRQFVSAAEATFEEHVTRTHSLSMNACLEFCKSRDQCLGGVSGSS